MQPSLTIVGAGILAPNQLTLEADRALRGSSLILYVVGDAPAMISYLQSLGPKAVDMNSYYRSGELDEEVYRNLSQAVIAAMEGNDTVSFVVNGHPLIYNLPVRIIAREARKRGYRVNVLPGISSIDTMLMQLGIEIGSSGLQVYDANRFVYYGIEPDVRVPLILFQPGCFGSGIITIDKENAPRRFERLCGCLMHFYGPDHVVRILRSSMASDVAPLDISVEIRDLPSRASSIDYVSSLYVPARERLKVKDQEFF